MHRNDYYRFCLIVWVFSHSLMNASCGQQKSKKHMSYLNLTPPGTEAEIFAPGIVTYSSFNHVCPTLSPDCKEIYWPSKDRKDILVSKLKNDKWSDPEVFSVLKGFKADCPVISPDGNKMLFNSSHPIDENDRDPSEKIWLIERTGNGWSTPRPLCDEINSDHLHWQASIDLQGNVYFGSERSGSKGKDDIFVSRYIDGRYTHPVSMSESINTEMHESTPFMDPDGKYLIFSRTIKAGRYGQNDLFISFNEEGKGWTKAQNLGSKINTELGEGCPYVSPDGQYLFFLRMSQERSEIYWIRTESIECFRH